MPAPTSLLFCVELVLGHGFALPPVQRRDRPADVSRSQFDSAIGAPRSSPVCGTRNRQGLSKPRLAWKTSHSWTSLRVLTPHSSLAGGSRPIHHDRLVGSQEVAFAVRGRGIPPPLRGELTHVPRASLARIWPQRPLSMLARQIPHEGSLAFFWRRRHKANRDALDINARVPPARPSQDEAICLTRTFVYSALGPITSWHGSPRTKAAPTL